MPSTYKYTSCQFFRVDIPWAKLEEHVEIHEREIRAIPGNGYCLINSIIECMATDFNHHIKQQHLLDQIVDELYKMPSDMHLSIKVPKRK